MPEQESAERWEARHIEGAEEVWYDENGYWAVVVEGEEINGEPIEVCVVGCSDSAKQRAEKIAVLFNAMAGIPDPAAWVEAVERLREACDKVPRMLTLLKEQIETTRDTINEARDFNGKKRLTGTTYPTNALESKAATITSALAALAERKTP